MAFTYQTPPPASAQTPTAGSKSLLVKSFKIDIANGSGATTATAYTVGTLPKGSQVMLQNIIVTTAGSGGGVTASTLTVTVGGQNIVSGVNFLSTGQTIAGNANYYTTGPVFTSTTDQTITYTLTNTTGNPTAGVAYVNIYYVV